VSNAIVNAARVLIAVLDNEEAPDWRENADPTDPFNRALLVLDGALKLEPVLGPVRDDGLVELVTAAAPELLAMGMDLADLVVKPAPMKARPAQSAHEPKRTCPRCAGPISPRAELCRRCTVELTPRREPTPAKHQVEDPPPKPKGVGTSAKLPSRVELPANEDVKSCQMCMRRFRGAGPYCREACEERARPTPQIGSKGRK
jgi:hypothetical protein